MQDLVPVEYLASGQCGDVHDVSGDPAWVARLSEMGVRIGCRLKVLQPGRTCLLQIGANRLSLRNDQAAQILVRLVS